MSQPPPSPITARRSNRNLLCPAPLGKDDLYIGLSFVCVPQSGSRLYATVTTEVHLNDRDELIAGVTPANGQEMMIELTCLGITASHNGNPPTAISYERPTRVQKTNLIHPDKPVRSGQVVGEPFLDDQARLAVYVRWDDLRVPHVTQQRIGPGEDAYRVGNFEITLIW